jgi:hypothetical protein
MGCKRYQEWLALAVSADLVPRRERQLVAHLRDCADCRRLRQELETLRGDLGALAEPATSRSFLETRRRVWVEIDGTAARSRKPYLTLGLAAAVLALFALGMVTWYGIRPLPSVEVETAVSDRRDAGTVLEGSTVELEAAATADPQTLPPEPWKTIPADVVSTQPTEPALGAPSASSQPIAETSTSTASSTLEERSASPARGEPILVKLLSNDPDLVIYWMIEPEVETDEDEPASSTV